MTAETLLDRLDKVKATAPDRWLARCPGHDDKSPSLSVRVVDDRVLIHCFAGCSALDVVQSVGLTLAHLFEDSNDASTRHFQKPTHRRIPARDILAAIDFEALTVAIIAADISEHKDISAEQWERLATAASRIGAARDMCR